MGQHARIHTQAFLFPLVSAFLHLSTCCPVENGIPFLFAVTEILHRCYMFTYVKVFGAYSNILFWP